MSTCDWPVDPRKTRSQPSMSKNLPEHWVILAIFVYE